MSFFRRVISSLDPLVFFEAAARHQSYSRAARELNVSQVAVSKRIRGLEAEVGRPLFVRQGRTIALTAEGHVFSERTRSGLAFLEDAVHAARATSPRSRQVIQVAANENMNFFWLAPLVRDFQMTGNDPVISVVTANNVTDVVRTETDLAIFYGKAPPEGWHAVKLFEEIIAPVTSPRYRAMLEHGSLKEVTLLDYRKESPEWVNWETLATSGSSCWFPHSLTQQCSSYIQSVSLALDGKGVALGVLPMLRNELKLEKLVALTHTPIRKGHGYYLATTTGRTSHPAVLELISYLQDHGKN